MRRVSPSRRRLAASTAGIALLACALVACLAGCGTFFSDAGSNLIGGVIDRATDGGSQEKLTGLETNLIDTARDQALSPETTRLLKALVDQTAADLSKQIVGIRNAALDEQLRSEVGKLREEIIGKVTREDLDSIRNDLLGGDSKAAVRALLDEALGPSTQSEIGALAGPPLQASIDQLIDGASPHLAAATQAIVKAAIDAAKTSTQDDVETFKHWAIGLGIAAGVLLVLVAIAGVVIKKHRTTIQKHGAVIRLLTRDIEDLGNSVDPTKAAAAKDLKERISLGASAQGIESYLQGLLVENGIRPKGTEVRGRSSA